MKIAMFGHKRVPSREGGIEIVVEELSARMVAQGHQVTCYNRRGHHVSGAQFDTQRQTDFQGVKLESVWTLDKKGLNSDGAVILEETDENGNKIPITNGFTVHGYQVNEEGQAAHLSITNAQNWVQHTTSVYVEKKWDDSKDHTYDAVTIYLQVTDPNGTVRRIRQINLSEENEWHYTWTNLPMYRQDPETGQEDMNAPMVYSVVEAYVPGYQQSTTVLKNGTLSFPPDADGILSVFCLGADATGVNIEGLQYILKDGTLSPGFPLGVSNHFTGCSSTIEVTEGSLLVMWDRANGFPIRD